MPSPLHVPVALVSEVRPHPNADSLDIAHILGWQCVVKRGQFTAGDKVVYFPPDTVLPRELSDSWGVTNYLDKQRIKATSLRGEPSFGLVMPCERDDWQVGENVAEHYDVTKWEPPVREQRSQGKFIANPDAVPRNPLFTEYTNIANLRHYPDIFAVDELVVVTEKLHGTNSRIGMIDGEWMAGSHRMQRGEGDALYWSPRKHAERLVAALAKHHRQVILYGEILGSGVQSLDYGYKGYEGYRAFDLMIDGRYLDFHAFYAHCEAYEVPIVPVISQGAYGSLQRVCEETKGKTMLNTANHLREGVVVRPLIGRTDPRVGRVILKYVSDDFLLAKKSDFAEI